MSDGDADPDADTGADPEPGTDPDGPSEEWFGGDHSGETSPGEDAVDGHTSGSEVNPDGSEGLASPSEPAVAPEEIDVEELTGPVRRLDPRVRYVWMLGSVTGALVLGGIAGVLGFVVLDRPLIGPAVFLALLSLGVVLAVLRYRSWSYEVREDSLYLERGVLTRTRTVVPYVRIQHVDASRGPVERALGLATAVVYTAGSRGADVSIPGLTTDRADDLQERLKRLAIVAEGEDAV
ncbi:MAG: PH domain-containing protein [Haloarculaceae archaeon]